MDGAGSYVMHQLAHTTATFGKLLASRLNDVTSFSGYCYGPADMMPHLTGTGDREYFFSDGWPRAHTAQSWEAMARLIASYLREPNRLVLLEDFLYYFDDITPGTRETPLFHLRNELYGILTSGATREQAMEALREFESLPVFNGVFAANIPLPNEELDDEWISRLADRAEVVFTGAFDGEGYVVAPLNAEAMLHLPETIEVLGLPPRIVWSRRYL